MTCLCLSTDVNSRRRCLSTADGRDYLGSRNRTISGRVCQPWNSDTPHLHPYNDVNYFADSMIVSADGNFDVQLDNISNFCRNPSFDGSYEDAPWCYTTDPDISKEFCLVPFCQGANPNFSLIAYIVPLSYRTTDRLHFCSVSKGNRSRSFWEFFEVLFVLLSCRLLHGGRVWTECGRGCAALSTDSVQRNSLSPVPVPTESSENRSEDYDNTILLIQLPLILIRSAVEGTAL